MKKQLQKLSSILLCFVMLVGLMPTTALAAEGTYTKLGDISAVEATATIDPALGKDTIAPSFTINSPVEQGVRIGNQSWYKKNASNEWVWVGSAEQFEEGIYRLQVQLRTDKNADKEYYAISADTTLTVNGVRWNAMDDTFYNYYDSNGYGYQFYASPEFTLSEKTLDSIAVTTPPTKAAYREGEDFNPAGMVVTATYTDSTTAPVVLYTVTDGTALTAGKTFVTISYTEGGETKTTTQAITVAKEYTVTVEGGTGGGKYIAGETVTVSAFVASGQKFKEWQGTEGLTFTSGDKNSQTATFTMPAQDLTVKAVTEADDTKYLVSVEHGSGDGNYAMGDIVTITADAPPSGMYFAGWEVSDGLTLHYAEDTDSRSSTAKFYMLPNAVSISAVYQQLTLVRIDITHSPAKTAYTAGESFDPAGMEVIATYSDRSTAPVTGYTVSPAGALSESDTAITVTYTEGGVTKTATQTITVAAASGSGGTSSSGSGGGVSTYAITVKDAKNGDISSSHKSASAGATVTLTVEADKGYALETLTVTDGRGKEVKVIEKSGKYTFKMPASKVTVEATFMEDNTMLNYFVDVSADAYYYDAVLWAAEEGITSGTDAVHFSPDVTCTRAQAVTFLWRAAGSPEPKSSAMPFEDAAADAYYYDAVLWAVENGITAGTTAATFAPNATCTRAQIVTFLWRSQRSPAADSVNPFTDVAVDAYYNTAVLWAAENGITGGTSATTFSPSNDCTRAQIVTFLFRCLGE